MLMLLNLLQPQNLVVCFLLSIYCGITEPPCRPCLVNSIAMASNLINEVLKEFTQLFNNSLGTIRGHQAKIYISDTVSPKQFHPRRVPLALKEQLLSELEHLVKEEPVDTTLSWASPIVVALKSNGSLRICADFKVTIDKHVQVDDYPLPWFEDVTSKLSGAYIFQK